MDADDIMDNHLLEMLYSRENVDFCNSLISFVMEYKNKIVDKYYE